MSSNPPSLEQQCASQSQQDESCAYEWASHPRNPWNWSTAKKSRHMAMLSLAAFTASIGTSIMSAARTQLMDVFEVSNTVALLPLALYVLALGFGPVVAGPLSESFGRHPVYLGTTPLGAAFTLGAGFTHNFGALCFLRFMAGFCWGPVLATAAGSLSDLFEPKARGPPSAVFILMPFLGPGLGPVVGSYVVVQRGWRWTQWTLLFLAAVSFLLTLVTEETNHEIIQRKMKSSGSRTQEKSASSSNQLRHFVTIALLRPLQMLFTEPIVSLTCLYVSAGFGTLFSFFAGVPYSFGLVYGFSLKQSGLVFLSIVIGCLLGLVTILVCDVLLYRKELAKRAPGPMPPEYRLYPAMFGSLGMPLGLFWFAWTTKSGISWASPAASMISFSWGNLCVFVATTQYVSDTFPAQVVASSASANALARYGFAAAFPLFTIKMYESLGIGWATSLLGFVSLVLVPIPWCFFKFGPTIRSKSRFDAA